MAYKVSGSIQEPTTITVLNSDGIAQKTQSFSAGAWEINGLTCPSGTIIGFEEDDTFKGFGNVPFIEYDTRPSVPWTDTFLPEVDRTRWINYDLNPAYIYNNKMRMRTNSANTHCNIQSKYLISGDFDIELSFTLVEAPAITEWQLFFRLYFPCAAETISDDTSVQIRRCYNGANRYYFQGYNGGTPFATNVSVSDTSGKVRFVRSGSVITGYYWNGSSWTSIANQDYGTNFSGYPVRLLIGQNSLTGLPDAIIDYTDFKINSGTIQYRFDDRFNYNINYINPDTDVYKAVGGYPFPYTYNGKLRFDLSSTRPIADADLKEKLVGDFDVSVDCNILNGPATNQWQFKIMLFNSDFTYAVRVARYYIASVGHCFRSEITVAGVLDTYNVITTETNVSFRVKRIGTSLYTYYKAQSTAIWTLHRTTNGFTTDDLTCRLHGGTAYGAIAAADFDSLVINNANGINNKLLVDIPSNIPTTIPEPNTTLLLHFDESPLVDSSYNKYPLTLNGSVARSATQSKFGGYSGSFNGSTQFISIPNSNDFNFGTGNFTIDFWLRCGSQATYSFILSFQTSGETLNGWNVQFFNNVFRFQYISGGINHIISSSTSIIDNNWHHVALVRNSNTFTIYTDGISSGSDTILPIIDYSLQLQIGKQNSGNYWYAGYLDELRISKGIARWTSDFTPPTSAYSA